MVQAGRDAVSQGVKYIYGAKPEKGAFRVYSVSEINALRDVYGPACVWESDTVKAGHKCCDCSGLLTYATGYLKGSSQFKAEAVETHTLEQLRADWAHHIGWGLYMPGHIGIVSDVEGYYYAMDGSARNAVHLPLSYNGWTSCIKIYGVDYSEGVEMITKEEIAAIAAAVWNHPLATKRGSKQVNATAGELQSWGGSYDYDMQPKVSDVYKRLATVEKKVDAIGKKLV